MDLPHINALLSDIVSRHALPDHGVLRLNEPEVFRLLSYLGLTAAPHVFAPAGVDEKTRLEWAEAAHALAEPRQKLVLKVVGREILHKTEAGGVRMLSGPDETSTDGLLAGWKALVDDVAAKVDPSLVEGVIAEGFVAHRPNVPGQEVLLSLRLDPAFGPVVVLGVGGTLTEWFAAGSPERSTFIVPAEGFDAAAVGPALAAHPMLSLLCAPSRLYPQPPMDVGALVAALGALAEMGRHFGGSGDRAWQLVEIEINPAVIHDGSLVALDGVGGLARSLPVKAPRPIGKIRSLLEPSSAAVVGVSAKGANPGRIILDNLRHSPGIDPRRLYVIHGREKEIAGVRCVAAVADLPEKVDLAVVSVPAEGAMETIAALCDQDRADSIILIPGGFAEAGRHDLAAAIERKLDDTHREPAGGPVMVGANCLGIVSRDQYNTFFLPRYKLPFNPGHGSNLALVSQSGAYLVTFASNYDGLISPRASISYGNQMDLTVADFMAYFLDDPDVNVIACYVEGFGQGDGARFCDLARRCRAAGKRVVIFKAGKTPLGARAAASHTASLAGDYAVARTCLEQAGVSVADSLGHFEDLIMTFTLLAPRPAAGRRTGILSNAGFECSTVMDQLAGLELANFDAATQAVLDEILPDFAHRTNPIDCTPMTGTDAFAASCRAILACPTVDAAILSSVPVTPALNNLPAAADASHAEDLTDPASQPSQMAAILKVSAKPAVIVVDSGGIYDPMCRQLMAAGIPVFRKIDRAARALAAFCAIPERLS